MLESFFYIPLGLILLYYGAEGLVSGASRLALGLGVSALSVGLTVVAFGTSAPELFVSLHAALSGMEDVALGNVVGSNICNIALILGVAAVLKPVEINARLIKWDMPVLIIASSWMLYALVNKNIGRVEGAICFLGLVAYLIFNLWEAKREAEPVKEVIQSASPQPGASLGRNLLFIALGLAGLALGASWFVRGAIVVAEFAGLSPAFIGLTIVAVGTSLPELAVTVLAARRGQGDIAVGNIVGSNIFNIFGIVGITAMVQPLERGGVLWQDLAMMAVLTAALVPLLLSGPHLTRSRGVLLLGSYFAYLAWRISIA